MELTRRRLFETSGLAAFAAATACAGQDDRPSDGSDLSELDAIATAAAIARGDVSAEEVVSAAIARAEKVEPEINAIVTAYFETAREKAAAGGEGPWFGVPTFIKDLNHVRGQRTGFGARAFNEFIATTQSDMVNAVFNAGMISLGKSATPEFGLSATTEPMSNGPTCNPWNTAHSSGGSSGGAAALVAARVVPVAHASDGGGSIRIPASCCNVFGLKATRGRMPDPERDPNQQLIISEHGLETRSVRDTAAFLAMAEREDRIAPVGLVEGASETRRKIGVFVKSPSGVNVDPAVAELVLQAASKLADLGHEVEEIAPPFDSGVLQDFSIYWGAGAAKIVNSWSEQAGLKADYRHFEPWTYGLIDFYESRANTLDDVVRRLLSFEQLYGQKFGDFDLLLSPVLATPPPSIGYLDPRAAFPLQLERIMEYACFTQFANVSGAPAASAPAGFTSDGLPVGMHIAAKHGEERKILELAYEWEAAAPWNRRRPSL